MSRKKSFESCGRRPHDSKRNKSSPHWGGVGGGEIIETMNRYATPPVVLNLLIINALMLLVMELLPMREMLIRTLALFDVGEPEFRLWQPVTYMFLHDGFSHLFFNMFALWMFGRTLEWDLGSRRFLLYYMVCGIGAGLIQLLVGYLTHAGGVTVGASGAVFGVLLAFGMLHPNERVMLLIPPIPMKAKWFVIIYGLIELFFGVSGTMSNVAHFAHVGGMLFGLMLLLYWKHRYGKRRVL